MDSNLERRRATLLDRHDAAVARWPDRKSAGFQTELADVGRGLIAKCRSKIYDPADLSTLIAPIDAFFTQDLS